MKYESFSIFFLYPHLICFLDLSQILMVITRVIGKLVWLFNFPVACAIFFKLPGHLTFVTLFLSVLFYLNE